MKKMKKELAKITVIFDLGSTKVLRVGSKSTYGTHSTKINCALIHPVQKE